VTEVTTEVTGVAGATESDLLDEHEWRLQELLERDPRLKRLLSVEGVADETFLKSAETTIQQSKVELNNTLATLKEVRKEQREKLNSRPVVWSENVNLVLALLWLTSLAAIGVLALLKLFDIFKQVPYTPFLVAAGGLLVAYLIAIAELSVIERRTVSDVAVRYSHAQKEYDRKLFSLVAVPTARAAQTLKFILPRKDVITVTEAPELASRIEQDARIETRSFRRVFINLRRTGGSTVGLAGTRGVGKTELIRSFCEGDGRTSIEGGGTVGALLSVPVSYQADEFLSLLIRTLCGMIPGAKTTAFKYRWQQRGPIIAIVSIGALFLAAGVITYFDYVLQWDHLMLGRLLLALGGFLTFVVPSLALLQSRRLRAALRSARSRRSDSAAMQVRSAGATAARRRAAAEYARGVTQRVRYAETRKVTSEASISKIFTAKLGRERTLTDLPLNRADLFFEFEGLVKELRAAGYDIVVGLDELDKLQVDDDAIRFLNDMKVLFTISECSFLVTISQNAWSQFERRGLPPGLRRTRE
jgi:hypothetical protein